MAALRNLSTNRTIAERVERRTTFVGRARGLLGRTHLLPGEGLWIAPCSAIHTLGMRIAIDVVFVDAAGCVVRVERDVPPNRFAVTARGARAAIELGGGALASGEVRTGDYLELV